ncbi:MAG: type II toxin-antitoxin system VapC family toxin [Coriobacteriia bacterium]
MTSKPLRVATGDPVVIDSSVAFKWFDPSEEGAGVAADLLRAHGRDDIVLLAPSYLVLEVTSALLWRGAGPDSLERAVRFLDDVDLAICPLDPELLIAASRIASNERMALYGAVFVALAARFDAELVTADRKQARSNACRTRVVG